MRRRIEALITLLVLLGWVLFIPTVTHAASLSLNVPNGAPGTNVIGSLGFQNAGNVVAFNLVLSFASGAILASDSSQFIRNIAYYPLASALFDGQEPNFVENAGAGRIRVVGLYVSPVQGSVDLGMLNYHINSLASIGNPPSIPPDTQVVTLSGQVYTSSGAVEDLAPISVTFTTVQVTPAGIVVISPNGGETWPVGTTQNITWTYTGDPGSNVNIDLLKAGTVVAGLASGVSVGTGGIGSCSVTVPANLAAGNDYQVKVTSTTNSSYTDASNGAFNITMPTGSLTVSILPQAAIDAGAQWKIDSGNWQNSSVTVTNVSVGSHIVQFSDLTGWTRPADQTVSIQSGQLAIVAGTYVTLPPGSLTVTIQPQAAIDAGAQWQVDGGAWQVSGATVAGLTARQHPVTFKTVTGWVTPAAQAVTVVSGQLATSSATYGASGTRLELPQTKVSSGAHVQVTVTIGPVKDLLGIQFTVTYDPNVLTVQSVTAGAFGSAFSLSSNTPTQGQIMIAMAAGTPQTGSGQLIIIDFLASGTVGSSTALTFTKILLNDGAIVPTVINGSCAIVSTYQVSGKCSYWSSDTKPVRGVTLTFDGNQTLTQTSDASGNYAFPAISSGAHKLVPAKSDNADNGITAMDASYVLQYLVGLITLNSHQLTAADVNGNGFVSAMDASYILQKLVGLIGLPFPGNKKIWTFDSVERSYAPLNSDQTGQDFRAILIGDVNGNWSPPTQASAPAAKAIASKSKAAQIEASLKGKATLSVGKAVRVSKGHFAIPLLVKVQKGILFSGELTLGYAKNAFEVVAVNKGALSSDAMIASNVEVPGKIQIALASPSPISGEGELVSIILKQKKQKTALPHVLIRKVRLNDGEMKVVINTKDFAGETLQQDDGELLPTGVADRLEVEVVDAEAPQASITLTSPGGGEKWAAGSTQTIAWTHVDKPESLVNLDLLKNGLAVTTLAFQILLGAEGKGSHQWEVPAVLAPGDDYRIRVTTISEPSRAAASAGSFSILAARVQSAAGPDQRVEESARVKLSGINSTDPDGSTLGIASFEWTQVDGSPVVLSDLFAPEPTFTAPEAESGAESFSFLLTVTDKNGSESSDTSLVNVTWTNTPPAANAGPNQNVGSGKLVTLDGSKSSDAEGDLVAYAWKQIGGAHVTLSDPTAKKTTFIAPPVGPEGRSLVFQLTVTDQAGLRSRDTCVVNVVATNKPPVAEAGPDQTVQVGAVVTLDGTGSSDVDDGIVSYRWTQLSGSPITLAAPGAAVATFVAPEVSGEQEEFVFQLTVRDANGLEDTDWVIIMVLPGTN